MPNTRLDLSAEEARVLGCLLEKQRTTPEIYPLTLNSLRSACNQSTSRDPVVSYDDAILRDALHRLARRGMVRLASGSRAAKYRHLLAEALPLDDEENALICVLLLRGSQTPGELKQRAERMQSFATLDDVHAALERLIARDLVARRGRRPGQKEERYAQLLTGEDGGEQSNGAGAALDALLGPAATPAPAPEASAAGTADAVAVAAYPAREGAGAERYASPPMESRELAALTERVARLELELRALREELGVEEAAS